VSEPILSTVELVVQEGDYFPQVIINGQAVHTAYEAPIEIRTELADWHEVTVTLIAEKLVVHDGSYEPANPWDDDPTPIGDAVERELEYADVLDGYVKALADLCHVPQRYVLGLDPAGDSDPIIFEGHWENVGYIRDDFEPVDFGAIYKATSSVEFELKDVNDQVLRLFYGSDLS